ncbi:MAG: hypothetical protein ACLPVY_21785 [Acidimicrobiia bacterium]
MVTSLLAVVVIGTVVKWAASSSKKPLLVVRGVIGSESKDFFADPRVKAAFAKQGIDVQAVVAGSGQIATLADGSKYNFAFTPETSTVGQLLAGRRITTTYVPFYSPMAVATFTDVAKVLARANVAREHGGWWTIDMRRYLDLVGNHVSWNELPGNTAYPATKPVLITSTDQTASNTAAMYAAIVSYVANKNQVLESPTSVDGVVNRVSPVFLDQRYTEQSTEALFDEYLSAGQGAIPMLMISEAQFVARAADGGGIRPNMVLMYPVPDVLSKFTLVPLSASGDTVGRLLTDDPSLQQLAVEHGFRIVSKPAAIDTFVKHNDLAKLAPQPLDVIEPPTSPILDALMTTIDAALHVSLGPGPGPSTSNELLNVPAPATGR